MLDAMTEAAKRTAAYPTRTPAGAVVLMNSFEVPAGRDEVFVELWTSTSQYFRRQHGFRSLRLHRAVSPGATYRFVNVATWDSLDAFQAAHATEEFRRVVTVPEWAEFPSSPVLFEVVTEDVAPSA
jgi:heme-degrading monooxygenase HmoA